MTTSFQSLGEAAVAYAHRGYHVFPCVPKTKRPLTEHGLRDATADGPTVAQWWTASPTANIGLACCASGMVVIDIDRHGKTDGEATMAKLATELGPLPQTVEAVTGGGGRHLVFQAPAGAAFRGGLGPGLDIRHNAYIVVAPSVHPSGSFYRWLRSPLGELPAVLPAAWLVRMAKPGPIVATGRPPRANAAYGRAAVDAELERVSNAPAGERNNTLNEAAFKLGSLFAGGEISDVRDDLILEAMYAGLPEGEARKTVESGWGAGVKTPRTAPPRNRRPSPKLATAPAGEGEVEPPVRRGRTAARAYGMTETGGAELLAARLAGDWHYIRERGKWINFDGKRWTFDLGEVTLMDRTKLIAREFLAEAERGMKEDDARSRQWAQFAATAQRRNSRHNFAELAKSERGIAISFDDFDRDAWALNCANGTLDLRDGLLRPHRREDRITRLLPWEYDAKAECPRWKSFLGEILPDPETVEYVQRLCGYCLTGNVSEHVVVFCYGIGANGKSVFLNSLLTLLGDYGTQAPTSMLISSPNERHPAELVTLHGRRLVVCAEVPGGKAWNEELIKSISGGDPISARGMREDFWTFQPTHKMLISGNHKPDVRGQDEGIWRRWHLLPFERTIPPGERDLKLTETLAAEMPGILAWAVRGCLDWQRDRLKPSAKVLAATADYRTESDRLAPFIQECCVLDPRAIISRAALYRAYQTWSVEQGERRPLSTKTFAELVRGKGATERWTRENGKRCLGWGGIELAGNSSNSNPNALPPNSQIDSSREANPESQRDLLPGVATIPDSRAHARAPARDGLADDHDNEGGGL